MHEIQANELAWITAEAITLQYSTEKNNVGEAQEHVRDIKIPVYLVCVSLLINLGRILVRKLG